jgi:hypothetical protein
MALNPMSTVVFIRVEALDWAMAGLKGLATLLPVVPSSLALRVVNSGVVLLLGLFITLFSIKLSMHRDTKFLRFLEKKIRKL